jgi:hypothetical protein
MLYWHGSSPFRVSFVHQGTFVGLPGLFQVFTIKVAKTQENALAVLIDYAKGAEI